MGVILAGVVGAGVVGAAAVRTGAGAPRVTARAATGGAGALRVGEYAVRTLTGVRHVAACAPRFVLAALLLVSSARVLHGQERPPHRAAPHDTVRHAAPDTVRPPGPHGPMRPGPLGIPRTREGSGTAWLPDFSPMYAVHAMAGAWELMLHGNVFLQYLDEGSDRGDEQFGSVNWIMGMARRPLAGGDLSFRAMLSAEPLTVGECGYPDLLATGEFCDDLGPIHDRQHPHDLFMELAAIYDGELSRNVGLQLYGALSGEPALGPVAYPHRPSALINLLAPINHHWHDATHISFGVLTAGVFGRRWKLEGSLFNGREPDEERYDLDLDRLDSYTGRIWFLPNERWALQLSRGHLNEAEAHEPGEPRIDLNRTTASATYHAPVGSIGYWANTLVWGRNDEDGAPESTDGLLLESTLNVRERDVVFARGELVEKTGEDLVLDEPALEHEVFTVGKLQVGYMRQFGPFGSLLPGLGAGVSVSFVGEDLEAFYGETTPLGFAVFANVRPARMAMHPSHPMQVPQRPRDTGPGAHPGPHGRIPAPHGDGARADTAHPEMLHGDTLHPDTLHPDALHPDTLHRDAADPDRARGAHVILSLPDVTRAMAAGRVRLSAGEMVQQPFWSVPTTVFALEGARTPHAALHVNVYPTVEAARADAAKIGGGGRAVPGWVAPPHFFLARNVLITLLANPERDPDTVAAVERAVERLGGRRVRGS